MNTNNPWLQQRLNEEHQRQLREVAERERVAQSAQTETAERPRRSLLSKLRAEMTNLTTTRQQTEMLPTRS